MKRAFLWCAAALVACFCSRPTLAQSPQALFDTANTLYEQGKFHEAAAAYDRLVHGGQVSEPVYFNWGNALFKAGDIGRAIAAYQQAERLSPRDPDLRANLQFARNQVQGPTLRPDWAARWLGKLSLTEWTWLATASVWLWLGVLTVGQWKPGFRQQLRGYTRWLGVAAAVFCSCFAGAYYVERYDQRAIVVAPEVTARQAPFEESQSAFTLHDGAELQVLDRKNQWLQVRVDDHRIGWVRQDLVLRSPTA